MSGKHDKAGDEEQAAKLLLTGPIVIRGLGRGVKDAFRPGRLSRHRAFVAEGASEVVEAAAQSGVTSPEDRVVETTPLQDMLTGGPTVSESGPSSELSEAPGTQEPSLTDQVFPPDDGVAQTEGADGPEEDRVDDRPDDDAPPEHADAERPEEDDQPDQPEGQATGQVSEQADEPPSDARGEEIGDSEYSPEEEPSEPMDEPVSDVLDDFVIDPTDEVVGEGAPADVAEEPVVDFGSSPDDAPQEASAEDGEPADDVPLDDVVSEAEASSVDLDASDEGSPDVSGEVDETHDIARESVIDFGGPADDASAAGEPAAEFETSDDEAEQSEPDDPDTELPVDVDVPQQFEETVTPEYAAGVDDAGVEPDDGSVPEPSHSEAEGFDDAEAQAFVDTAAIESAAEPVNEAEESESASAPEERSDDAFRPVDETVDEPSDKFTDPTSDGWTEEPEFLQVDEADDETSGERPEPVSETHDGAAQLDEAERPVDEQANMEQPAKDEDEDEDEEPVVLQVEGADDETSGERPDAEPEPDHGVAQPEEAQGSVDEQAIVEQATEDESEEPEFLPVEEADVETSDAEPEPELVSKTDDERTQLDGGDGPVDEQAIVEQPAEDRSEESEFLQVDEADVETSDERPEDQPGFEVEPSDEHVADLTIDEAEVRVEQLADLEPVPESGDADEPEQSDGVDEPVDEHGHTDDAEPEVADEASSMEAGDIEGSVTPDFVDEAEVSADPVDAVQHEQPGMADEASVADSEAPQLAPEHQDSIEPESDDPSSEQTEPVEDSADEPDQGELVENEPAGFVPLRAEDFFGTEPVGSSDSHDESTDAVGAADEPAAHSDDIADESNAPDTISDEGTTDAEAEVDSAPTTDAEQIDPAAESAAEVGAEAEPAAPETAAAAVVVPAVATTSSSGGKPPRSTGGSGGSGRPPRRPRPVRERVGREAIGIAVLVVLALVCGGLITAVVLKTQHDAAVAAQEAKNYTPPPLATPTPTATGPVVAVIGDGTTSAAASGVTTAQKWSALMGTSLDASVTTDASSGMGYAAKGGTGETFVQAAAKIPSNADVVVFFGGAADSNVAPLSLAKAATDAFSAAKTQAPDAKLVVVGPPISQGVSAADLTSIRNTLRSAASIAKATWVDPVGLKWLPAAKQAAASPSALTAADEKTIGAKMQALVKTAAG